MSGPPREMEGSSGEGDDRSVNEALDRFLPMKWRWLRWVVGNLWWIQLVLIAPDWILFRALGARGLRLVLILTPHVFVSVAAVLAYRVFERLRDNVLRSLWDRKVIAVRQPRNDPMRHDDSCDELKGMRSTPRMRRRVLRKMRGRGPGEQYAAFIDGLHRRLNAWGWGVPLGLAFVGLYYWFFPAIGFQWGFPLVHPDNTAHLHQVVRVLLTIDLCVQVFLVAVLGLAAWRLIAIALEVRHLAGDFDLRVKRQHPDHSGGLGPLGDLCFSVAAVWAAVAIYPAAWALMLRFGPVKGTSFFDLAHITPKSEAALGRVVKLQQEVASLSKTGLKPSVNAATDALTRAFHHEEVVTRHGVHVLYLYVLIMFGLTFAFALLTFLGPLYYVHRGMVRQRSLLQAEVDPIGAKIDTYAANAGGLALKASLDSPTVGSKEERAPPAGAASCEPTDGETAPTPPTAAPSFDDATKELDALKTFYDNSIVIPAWPFDGKVLRKFIGATLIPLTGISVWLPHVVGRLFGG